MLLDECLDRFHGPHRVGSEWVLVDEGVSLSFHQQEIEASPAAALVSGKLLR